MTTTYEHIQILHEAGDSPADIVSKIQHITPGDVDLGELMAMLNDRGMLSHLPFPDPDTQSKWTGTVINMMNAIMQAGTAEQKQLITRWFSHITNDRNTEFHTSDPVFAGAVHQLKVAFADKPNMPTAAGFDAIFALGGGQIHQSLTVERVEELIADNAKTVQRQSWQAAFDTAINKLGTSEQGDGVAEIRAIAAEMESA